MSMYHDQARVLVELFNSPVTIGGSILTQKLGIGLKTLKKEIDNLNDICAENGCLIKSKPGEGYYLEVTDQALYDDFRTHVGKMFHDRMYYRNKHSELRHLAIRLFLTYGNIYIDDLAEKCLCSESTINREMARIKQRLSEYKLSLVNKTNHGLMLSGSEWHVRLALINEYMTYSTFETVNEFDSETDFNEMFMHKGIYINMLVERVMDVLRQCDYHVPYYSFDEMANMIILTITRKKYGKNLDESIEWFEKYETGREQEIIEKIFENIIGLMDFELSRSEKLALAVYLRCHRVIKYRDFLTLSNHEEIQKLVEGFIRYCDQSYNFSNSDLSVLRKDLCCELSRLQWNREYDVHPMRYHIYRFEREGLMNLDFCTMLYLYLKDSLKQEFTKLDIGSFYYIFNYLSQNEFRGKPVNVRVISSQGFYISRSLANNLQNKSSSGQVSFRPYEYHELMDANMSTIDCILTDIPELKNDFHYKYVRNVYLMRKKEEVNALITDIINTTDYIYNNFREEDLSYVSGLNTVGEIEEYIIRHFLQEGDDRDLFRKELQKKTALFIASRYNGFVVLNTFGDFIGRDCFKIMVLDNEIKEGHNYIDKVVFYNSKGRDISGWRMMSQRIANLLHSHDLILTGDRESDYRLLLDTLMRSGGN